MERVPLIRRHLQLHARTMRGRVGSVGWIPPEDLSEDEWADVGILLARIDASTRWWVGDWWNHGIKNYGARKTMVESPGLARAIFPNLCQCSVGLSSIRNLPSTGSSHLRASRRGKCARPEGGGSTSGLGASHAFFDRQISIHKRSTPGSSETCSVGTGELICEDRPRGARHRKRRESQTPPLTCEASKRNWPAKMPTSPSSKSHVSSS